MALTSAEKGCVSAHATKQIAHPNAPTQSKYTIVLFQEYVDREAFDIHCSADYVKCAIYDLIENKETALGAEWQVRLFRSDD